MALEVSHTCIALLCMEDERPAIGTVVFSSAETALLNQCCATHAAVSHAVLHLLPGVMLATHSSLCLVAPHVQCT